MGDSWQMQNYWTQAQMSQFANTLYGFGGASSSSYTVTWPPIPDTTVAADPEDSRGDNERWLDERIEEMRFKL